MSTKTIITAFDHSFVWGTYLLLFSLRRHDVRLPVHVVTHPWFLQRANKTYCCLSMVIFEMRRLIRCVAYGLKKKNDY